MRRNLQPTKPETPGQTPSLNDRCTGFFYVHYTTHGTYSFTSHPKDEAIMVKCLAQGHKCRYRESNPHPGFLTTPELESGALDRSATTLGSLESPIGDNHAHLTTAVPTTSWNGSVQMLLQALNIVYKLNEDPIHLPVTSNKRGWWFFFRSPKVKIWFIVFCFLHIIK